MEIIFAFYPFYKKVQKSQLGDVSYLSGEHDDPDPDHLVSGEDDSVGADDDRQKSLLEGQDFVVLENLSLITKYD